MGGVVFSENTLVNLSTGLLTLPFFLFSASAGQIADKFDKAQIIRLVKLFEIGIMLLGAAGLRLHSVPLLLAVVFLMGTHSAVFGPVKYSILPQHLHADELVGGNALGQMGTFAAILLGTILGGALVKIGGEATVSATVLALAGAGWLASRGVPPAPAPAADLRLDWSPLRETLRIIGFARENRTVFLSILGISWFWFYGALFLAQFPGLTRHVLGGDEWVATLLLVVFSVGVALGCMLCERLSSRTVVLGIVLRGAGLTIPELVLVTAVVNAAVAVYIYTLIPEFLMRFLVWLLVHTIYRMRARGMENLPEEGAAVLVSNHVSFVDALVIAAACRRPIRFVMDHSYFRMPVLNFFCRTVRAIPIASRKDDPKVVEQAFDAVARALEEGSLVCIFPEGRLTPNGDLGPFRPGIERVVERTPVPVVPMALRGLWGSFFSRRDGRAMSRPFRRFWSRIECVCGEPIAAPQVTAAALQERVLALRGELR